MHIVTHMHIVKHAASQGYGQNWLLKAGGCLMQVPTNNLNCRANYGLVNLWSNFENCNTDLHIGKTIFQ